MKSCCHTIATQYVLVANIKESSAVTQDDTTRLYNDKAKISQVSSPKNVSVEYMVSAQFSWPGHILAGHTIGQRCQDLNHNFPWLYRSAIKNVFWANPCALSEDTKDPSKANLKREVHHLALHRRDIAQHTPQPAHLVLSHGGSIDHQKSFKQSKMSFPIRSSVSDLGTAPSLLNCTIRGDL